MRLGRTVGSFSTVVEFWNRLKMLAQYSGFLLVRHSIMTIRLRNENAATLGDVFHISHNDCSFLIHASCRQRERGILP
jgi:hypothetical protein